jgi:aminoglycoside 6'-N-acetyltransferase
MGVEAPTLRGRTLELRPLAPGEDALLRRMAEHPDVQPWIGDDWPPVEPYTDLAWVIRRLDDDQPLGYIETSEQNDPECRSANIDLFLGGDVTGRGIGREAIALVADHLFSVRGHHRLTIDPAAHNSRGIACYRAVGYRDVGVMRRYAKHSAAPDWEDALLLDMLPEDLNRALLPD